MARIGKALLAQKQAQFSEISSMTSVPIRIREILALFDDRTSDANASRYNHIARCKATTVDIAGSDDEKRSTKGH